MIMAVYLVGAMNSQHGHHNQSKFIQSCSTVLVSMVATYLTLMVLVECTVRVILLKLGIETRGMNVVAAAHDRQLRHVEDEQKRLAALEQSISKSLRDIGYEHDNDDKKSESDDENDEPADSSCCASAGCAECHRSLINSAKGNCCSICLDEFQPGDAVVSGRRECCKSNLFHEECIKTWLRINDSCPCCRSPMLEEEDDQPKTTSNSTTQHRADLRADRSSEGHAGYFRSQFRIKIDTATRLRNEILSYYMEATNDPHGLSHESQRYR